MININYNDKKKISNTFYGIFFEDINFSLDGGVNNNQIINNSYEAVSCDLKKDFYFWWFKIFHAKRKFRTTVDTAEPLKYWTADPINAIKARTNKSINDNNPHYAQVTVNGMVRMTNNGYNGGDNTSHDPRYSRRNGQKPSVGIMENKVYDVSVFIKNESYKGSLSIYIESENGQKLTSVAELDCTASGWTEVKASVTAIKTAIGRFVAEFKGEGIIDVDMWYFGSAEYWGAGDPKWTGGRFRKDLVELLRELKPKFIRFPGGCLVEGHTLANSYEWKDTVGKVEERKQKANLWCGGNKDKCYMQSYAIGFYEFFLLCEDLNSEPLPILNAGLACQGRIEQYVTIGNKEFEKRKQDILDLIEYANGDPATSKWAKLRADSGHPAPFNLKMIGIGNENMGEIYNKNFDDMVAAVKAKYPDIDIVWSAGFHCYKCGSYDENRSYFDGKHDDLISDDHFYREPEWVIKNEGLYDDYPRNKCRIFLGEYAANTPWNNKAYPNNWYSALAEAAFLTGLERNGDIVVMSSYAPLFSRIGGAQWAHNMINYNSLYSMETANYLVQKLFSANIGDQYIAAKSQNKGVYISVTTDGKKLYIKAVNVNRVPVTEQFNIGDNKLGSTTVLACDDDYMRNELSFDGMPEMRIEPVLSAANIENGVLTMEMPARSVNVSVIDL